MTIPTINEFLDRIHYDPEGVYSDDLLLFYIADHETGDLDFYKKTLIDSKEWNNYFVYGVLSLPHSDVIIVSKNPDLIMCPVIKSRSYLYGD